MSIDSAKDFYELTQLKIANPTTGLLMIGGGVPKNFAQDIVVAAEVLGVDAPMHKYAIQITVADVRDGALSGSTLKEASSWGKVDTTHEQMVYAEATLALPLVAGYAMGILFWNVSPVPQGIGVVEGVMVLVYTSLGINGFVAASIVLAFRGLNFWLPMLLGFILLKQVKIFGPKHEA